MRRTEDTECDRWRTFNAVHENLTRGGQRDWMRPKADGSRYSRTRPIKGLDQGIRLNKALWDLAAAYAAN